MMLSAIVAVIKEVLCTDCHDKTMCRLAIMPKLGGLESDYINIIVANTLIICANI